MRPFFLRPQGAQTADWRARAILAGKVLLAALLLAFLTRSGALAPGAILRLEDPVGALTAALICVLTALGLGVYRWQLVLAAAGICLAYPRALQLYWIGAFASTLLPGAVSGDLLRAAMVARDTPGARAQAAASVAVDRAIGLLGFALAGFSLLAIRVDALRDSPALRHMAGILALVVACAVILGLGARWLVRVFSRRRSGTGPHQDEPRADARRPTWFTGGSAADLSAVFGISLAIPLLLAAGLLPFLPDSPREFASLVDVTIASIAAQVANTLPLTPGGVGIGEGVFEYVASLLHSGAAGYATAFLSLRLVTILVNAAGGLFLLIPGNSLRSAVTAPQPPGGNPP